MNKHFILLSAVALLLFSCAREADHEMIQPGETITFRAGWAGNEGTRTILQSDGTSVWWDTAEQINLFFSDKASGRFTSTNSQPQAIVDFQGSLPIAVGSIETENPAHAYWGVYPYNAANTCDGESVTLTVPTTQTAKAGTFDNKMFPSIATSTNFYLAFYNVCGGARFTVYNEGITSVTFKANNDESLAGKVQVGFDSVPVIQSVLEGVSEVTVNAPEGGFVPGQYYFVTILPQTLSKGLSLTFRRSDGKVATTSLNNSITINRSRFGKMENKDEGLVFVDEGGGHEPTDIIVFADERVKTRLVAKFDTNGDGELSYAEAAAVTSIEGVFTIKTIVSFDEFQYFTGVTIVPNGCFMDWTQLTSIILPSSIVSIGGNAFARCYSLESMTIPESVLEIGERAFYQCNSLKTISIPERVEELGRYAFYKCSSLTSVTLPRNLKVLKEETFMDCSSLYDLVLPERLITIETQVFYNCNSLAELTIPRGVTSIGTYAFSGCSSLSSLFIPENVSSIGNYAFARCGNLLSIQVDSRNPYYDSRMDCNAIIEKSKQKLICGCRNTLIPETVTIIGEAAFLGCNGLIHITIPETVTSIEKYAFSQCVDLESFSVPESISVISKSTCSMCSKLSSVSIPESVSQIGEEAFYKCDALTVITIPESVVFVGTHAFKYCTHLTSVTVKAQTPPQGGAEMFERVNYYFPIYVPAGSVDAYRNDYYWGVYGSRIQAIPEG